MNPDGRPSTTTRSTRLVVAAGARLLLLLVAIAIPAGCLGRGLPSSSATSRPVAPTVAHLTAAHPASGLNLLAGRVGGMNLEQFGADGRPVPRGLPDPGVAWISAGPDGELLATTIDGRAFLGAGEGRVKVTAWRALGLRDGEGTLARHLAFGTLSADGAQAAFLSTDADPADTSVLVADLVTDRAKTVPLGGESAGWPPIWLGQRLVVLRRSTADRVAAVVVRTDGEGTAIGPTVVGAFGSAMAGGIAGIAGSVDRRIVAVLAGDYATIAIFRPNSSGAPDGSAGPVVRLRLAPLADGSDMASWLAISPDGSRLAVVRMDAVGDAVAVEIHASSAGWAETARLALPSGADRAVVAWGP